MLRGHKNYRAPYFRQVNLPGPASQTEEKRQLKKVGAKVQRFREDRQRVLGERTGI